ncbi:MAG: hypothetical protein M3168_02465 [Actinomycetota bacterium]|nr:hypothetical protein [Actinomycetota bacterium]
MSRLVALYGTGIVALAALVALAAADPWTANGGDATEAVAAGDLAGAITFELWPRNGSGQFGFVTLEPRGDGARVAVELFTLATARAFVREGSCRRPGQRLHDLGVVTRRASADLAATALATLDAGPGELRSANRIVTVERNGAVSACVATAD